jgi:type II secretory pathway pseudopilin PulG
MGALFEILGALIISALAISLAAYGINTGMSQSKLNATKSAIMTTRMLTQQAFYGETYAELNNDLAIGGKLVGDGFVKANRLKNEWGGDVTLAGIPSDAAFSIALSKIPRFACINLARGGDWRSISVNGSDVSSGVAAVIRACGNENTVTYTSY